MTPEDRQRYTDHLRERIAELEAALGALVSALGAPECGEIGEAAEAAANRAIDVLAKCGETLG